MTILTQAIKLPTPTASNPVNAMTTHCELPPVSIPLAPMLFDVELVVAAEEVDEAVLAAFTGPMLPP